MDIRHFLIGLALACSILAITFGLHSCKDTHKYIEKLNGSDSSDSTEDKEEEITNASPDSRW